MQSKPSEGDTEPIRVSEINKRTIGRAILQLCGNEGSDDSFENEYLRRLLQGCIDSIQQHPDVDWSNATMQVFGIDGGRYEMVAGAGEDKVFVMLDGKDQVKIIKKQQSPRRQFVKFLKSLWSMRQTRIAACVITGILVWQFVTWMYRSPGVQNYVTSTPKVPDN